MQTAEITQEVNKTPGHSHTTRNVINTMLYTNRDKFRKVSYGRWGLLDEPFDMNNLLGLVKKLIKFIGIYQDKFGILNYDDYGIFFIKKEKELIIEVLKDE